MKPQTTFAGNINPFKKLIDTPASAMTKKPIDKRLKANRLKVDDCSTLCAPPGAIVTTPNHIGDTAKNVSTPALPAYLVAMGISITDDPLPSGRIMAAGARKYDPLFHHLPYGKSIKANSEHVGKIAGALRKFLHVHKKPGMVRTVKAHPADGMGRIWLLEKSE